MIDGRKLEALLASCIHLENFSFISQCEKKNVDVSDLLRSFKSEFWLDIRRLPVLIHYTDFGHILIVSMPCSFSNISKDFHFSSNLRRWHLNKGKFDSPLIRFMKPTSNLYFSNEQPISLEFLQLAGHIFCSRKQMLECNDWGLMFEQELFEQVSLFRFCFNHISLFKKGMNFNVFFFIVLK